MINAVTEDKRWLRKAPFKGTCSKIRIVCSHAIGKECRAKNNNSTYRRFISVGRRKRALPSDGKNHTAANLNL